MYIYLCSSSLFSLSLSRSHGMIWHSLTLLFMKDCVSWSLCHREKIIMSQKWVTTQLLLLCYHTNLHQSFTTMYIPMYHLLYNSFTCTCMCTCICNRMPLFLLFFLCTLCSQISVGRLLWVRMKEEVLTVSSLLSLISQYWLMMYWSTSDAMQNLE